jgi:hypothetical protein
LEAVVREASCGTAPRSLCEEREPKPILFIDKIHLLLGAGSASGSMDAANILKRALARGAIQVIGATTIPEYRQTIEKDDALERRFQAVRRCLAERSRRGRRFNSKRSMPGFSFPRVPHPDLNPTSFPLFS